MPKAMAVPYSLEFHREVITETTIGHHILGPEWSATDAAGHVHSTLDTLVWVVTGTYWCDDCRDEHDEGEYRCRQCEAVVEPRYVFTGPQTFNVPGLLEVTLRMADGRIFRLRPEEIPPRDGSPPSAEWLAAVTSREPDEWTPA